MCVHEKIKNNRCIQMQAFIFASCSCLSKAKALHLWPTTWYKTTQTRMHLCVYTHTGIYFFYEESKRETKTEPLPLIQTCIKKYSYKKIHL